VFGLLPVLVTETVVVPAAAAILGESVSVSLYLWHGFNTALGLSVLSVVLGLALFFGWEGIGISNAISDSPARCNWRGGGVNDTGVGGVGVEIGGGWAAG